MIRSVSRPCIVPPSHRTPPQLLLLLTSFPCRIAKDFSSNQKEVLGSQYCTKLENLDITGQRASPEGFSDIKRREVIIMQWVRDEKDAVILAGAQDLSDERETQRFSIIGINMTQAVQTNMIMDNMVMVMSELLSTKYTLYIIAGVAQLRRKVIIAPNDSKEVLKIGRVATLLQLGEYRYCHYRKKSSIAVIITVGTSLITDPIAIEVHWIQILWKWLGQKQQILLISIYFCEQGNESTVHMGKYTAELLEAIQLELDWTLVTITEQLMSTVLISRTLLATEATCTNDEHAKVFETQLGKQPCACVTAAAVRRQDRGKRACEF
ncbi:MAG: hypothetical protein EZS28_033540 [Streblomastix strix]|uniref:Uncharacterized protein n=1 Tax=Streblomastix strix TaxID=222440 RepID=A0A5J4ULK5_9EUKA|nr:MAG: hypothetical protein EZS28_033540 [Streblomastix strix]